MTPPSWDSIAPALRRMMPAKKDVIFVGTGGWIHAVRGNVTKLHSLDPRALAGLPDDAAVIGMSQSRTTVETRLLMQTLAERYDDVSWLPLPPPASALFAAPFTYAFLLPLAIERGLAGAAQTYAEFLRLRGDIRVPDATEYSHPSCDPFLRQLCRQGLRLAAPRRVALAIDTGDDAVDAMLAADAACEAVRRHPLFVADRFEPRYKVRIDPEVVVLGDPLDLSAVPDDAVVYAHDPPRGIEGSDWNHHSYDHAAADPAARLTIVDPLGAPDVVVGFSLAALERNTRTLKAIARATHETLPGSTLISA